MPGAVKVNIEDEDLVMKTHILSDSLVSLFG